MKTISIPVSEPIGFYRFQMALVPTIEINKPYYAIRKQYLPMRKDWFLQILVMTLGEMVWINVGTASLLPLNSHS